MGFPQAIRKLYILVVRIWEQGVIVDEARVVCNPHPEVHVPVDSRLPGCCHGSIFHTLHK
jgi:hypothetical protein